MLKFEFKRSIGNRIFLYLFIITGIIFLMGWILPVGIDHAKEILLHEYLFSTYTVFTQFGFLFFSFGAVYYINRDYNQKNIMFYKMFNSNSLTCYLRKILVLFVEEVTCIVFFVFIVSVLYKSTNHVVTAGLLYILVSLYFLLTFRSVCNAYQKYDNSYGNVYSILDFYFNTCKYRRSL